MNALIAFSALFAVAHAGHYYAAPVVYSGHYASAAPLGHDGRVVDTPEVAQAKAAHFAEFAKAAGAAAHADHSYAPVATYAHGPAPLGSDGRVVDTPEVAHAKAVHFAEYAKAAGAASVYSPYAAHDAHNSYSYGAAPLGADGTVVETPEVAHAKAVHLAEHAKAAAAAYSAPDYSAYHAYPAYPAAPVVYSGYGYSAPLGHDGRVVETPEVAQAKAAHLAAHAAAAANAHAW